MRKNGFILVRSAKGNPSGFTLVELIVVIGIIAVLTVFIIPEFNTFNRNRSLQDSASELQSNIRVTQNNASSGVTCSGGVKASDWRLLVVNSLSYQIIPTCGGATAKVYTLPWGVTIYSVQFNTGAELVASGNGANLGNFGVAFANVSAVAKFLSGNVGYPVTSSTEQLIIKLIRDGDSSKYQRVIIEKGGSIYLN